mgnify:CR=1 FL=1
METRNYELMLVVSAELDEEALDSVLQRAQRYLESVEAQVSSFKSWGLRRLAYTIREQREGRYYLVHFTADSQVIPELDSDLRLIEGVLRHLITRVDSALPPSAERGEEVPAVSQSVSEPAEEPDTTEATETAETEEA